MPDSPKFFLGYGERLTNRVPPPGGGNKAELAYSFDQAVARLTPMLLETSSVLSSLPEGACPGGEVVGVITLHPQWMAKSYHPQQLLNAYDFRQVGSRPVEIQPERWTRKSEPTLTASSELYVAGPRESFQEWARELSETPAGVSQEIRRVELVRAPMPTDRLRNISNDESAEKNHILLEVVLHSSEGTRDEFILAGFEEYATWLGAHLELDRRLYVGGLCFLPVEAELDVIDELARFAFLRVARPMPRLRQFPKIERSVRSPVFLDAPLPTQGAIDPDLRIALFDGGLDEASPLTQWATAYEGLGMGPATSDYLAHGHDVTSAALFGPLTSGQAAPRPYAVVDHHRVLDAQARNDPFELYDVLRRIDEILRTRRYEFFNLSIGPKMSVEDDEVHPWTALIDQYLSDGNSLASLAVGNTGDEVGENGEFRIQVPSDCVNGLSVGAVDNQRADWKRATYSSRGPGRSPGVVKPDVVHFGGEGQELFLVYDPKTLPGIAGTCGTSFSAPAVLRLASGVRAHFGARISPLALKALLVHSAEPSNHHRHEVGWGRVPNEVATIALCGEGMVRIIYQGELSPSHYLRARIPTPDSPLIGNVSIQATFCYATSTDPQDPGSYTRSGLDVTFRPHAAKFANEDATVAKSQAFFKKSDFETEQALRNDAQKWETTLNAQSNFRASSLFTPVLDIHYNARTSGGASRDADKIRYALVVTVRAKRVPDLYNQVVRTFAGQLEPLLPIVEIPIRV